MSTTAETQTKKVASRQKPAAGEKGLTTQGVVDEINTFLDKIDHTIDDYTPILAEQAADLFLKTQDWLIEASDHARVQAALAKMEADDGLAKVKTRLEATSNKMLKISRQAQEGSVKLLEDVAEACLKLSDRLAKAGQKANH